MKFLIINGPNLQLLGKREPDHYGTHSLEDIELIIKNHANSMNIQIEFFQSNHEGAIIDAIGNISDEFDGIIINPAAYTHTSIGIHDALKGIDKPSIEVHLSNIYAREEFRHISRTAPASIGQICGFGVMGYKLAVTALQDYIQN